jgi:hypothetical protein
MLSDRIILLNNYENWYSNSINNYSCEYLIALYKNKPIGAVLISVIFNAINFIIKSDYVTSSIIKIDRGIRG